MSQFPSTAVKQKASEILDLLGGMTVAEIDETLALTKTSVGTFAGQQVYGRMLVQFPQGCRWEAFLDTVLRQETPSLYTARELLEMYSNGVDVSVVAAGSWPTVEE